MELFTKVFPSNCNIFLAGDTHEGSTLQHEKGIERLIHALQSKYADVSANYLIFMGDDIEGHQVDHKYYHSETHEPEKTPILQGRAIAKKFMPVRDKILYWHYGNHPLLVHKAGNVTRDVVCRELRVPYGTWSAKLTLNNKKGSTMFKMFTTHGFKSINSAAGGPIRRQSNMKIALKRILQHKAGDALLMACGHIHRLLKVRPHEENLYLIDDGEEISEYFAQPGKDNDSRIVHPDARWYVCTGSFYKLYRRGIDSYAEIKGYDPIQLGYAVVRVRDQQIQDVDEVFV